MQTNDVTKDSPIHQLFWRKTNSRTFLHCLVEISILSTVVQLGGTARFLTKCEHLLTTMDLTYLFIIINCLKRPNPISGNKARVYENAIRSDNDLVIVYAHAPLYSSEIPGMVERSVWLIYSITKTDRKFYLRKAIWYSREWLNETFPFIFAVFLISSFQLSCLLSSTFWNLEINYKKDSGLSQ